MRKMKILLGVVLFTTILMSINVNSAFVLNSSNELINAFKNNNLVRLHVVANSNSPSDQYLKRKVRDRLTAYMGKFADNKNIELDKKMDEINNFINKILEVEGINYSAIAELGSYYFPDRTYDDLTLPAGRYKALKIVLGKGEGANWWCVLLPPMCIENQKNGNAEDRKIEFRFKLLDWLMNEKDNNKKEVKDNLLNIFDDSNGPDVKNVLINYNINKRDHGLINEEKLLLKNNYRVINKTKFYDLINRYNDKYSKMNLLFNDNIQLLHGGRNYKFKETIQLSLKQTIYHGF